MVGETDLDRPEIKLLKEDRILRARLNNQRWLKEIFSSENKRRAKRERELKKMGQIVKTKKKEKKQGKEVRESDRKNTETSAEESGEEWGERELKKMGQIVKTKKKGRPSKADLAARCAAAAEEAAEDEQKQRDIRRSLRRRSNVRYSIIDYEEDYVDDEEFDDEGGVEEEEEDEDEGERRREKKLKFVLKLPSSNYHHYHQRSHQSRGRGRPPRHGGDSVLRNRCVGRRPAGDLEEDDDQGTEQLEEVEEEEERAVKKRKISGCDGDDVVDHDENEDNEDKGNKEESKRADSVPGTPDDTPSDTPMPEKKQLELILDKLQKKDTYAVYAEPVDPEELPDYHDIIEHPMDFATVRKKLAHGSYAILEELESDVFLICSNAMQYNSPETVYHKQARAIKELAERKFERLRSHIKRSLKEPKTEEKIPKAEVKIKHTPIVKKQGKKPIIRSTQEPVGSDFSAGATLATADVNTAPNAVQAGSCERTSNNDGHVEGISPGVDNNVEKVEDLSGKGHHSKFGRKSFVVDENRRATYDLSNQAVDRSDSIFSTFESEQKQLIPVGVIGEHSYARSLARFAATLGPVAWSIASKRIEQAIPPGFKYGRGWVGEYEPVATSVLVLGSCNMKEQPPTRVQSVALSGKSNNLHTNVHSFSEHLDNGPGPGPGPGPGSDVLFCSGITKPPTHTSGSMPQAEAKSSSSFGSGGSTPHTPSCDNEPRSDTKSSSLFGFGRGKPPPPDSENRPRLGGKSSLFGSGGNTQLTAPHDNEPMQDWKLDGLRLDGKPSYFIGSGGSKSSIPTGAAMQQRTPLRSALGAEGKTVKRPGSRSPSMTSQDMGVFKQSQVSSGPVGPVPPKETVLRNNSFLQPLPFKQPCSSSMTSQDTGFFGQSQVSSGSARPIETVMRNNNFQQPLPFRQPDTNGVAAGGLPNGKYMDNPVDINRMVGSPVSILSPQVVGSTARASQRPHQGISEPVQVMSMPTEKAKKQQNRSNISFGSSPVRPSVPSPTGASTSNAAAANVWMSVGAVGFKPASGNVINHKSQISADSLYSASRELHPPVLLPQREFPASDTMHFQSEKKIQPFQAFVPQPDRVDNKAHAPNRPLFFPQPVTNDSSRFQAHSSPWRGLSPHTQHRQKQDTLPPDLNIAFQSSVDSQQPDLALQL